MLNLFTRNRPPARPVPVTGSLMIRNLLEYPQLRDVMTDVPSTDRIVDLQIAPAPKTGSAGALAWSRRWGTRMNERELSGAA